MFPEGNGVELARLKQNEASQGKWPLGKWVTFNFRIRSRPGSTAFLPDIASRPDTPGKRLHQKVVHQRRHGTRVQRFARQIDLLLV